MTTYITQGRFTQQGIRGLLDKPEDRRGAAEAVMRAGGFRLIDYYVTLGEYDFLIIAEGPEGLNPGLLVAAATGAASNLKTTLAYTTADLKAAAEKAGGIMGSFGPAGG